MATPPPRRHGPPLGQPRPPLQRLELPQELIDLIVGHMKATHLFYPRKFQRNIYKLRAVCRVFDAGVFSEFAELFSEKTIFLGADGEGVDKLTKLSKSRLAPYVLKLKQSTENGNAATVEGFFGSLEHEGIRFPNLEELRFANLGMLLSTHTAWLQTHTKNLTEFFLRTNLTANDISYAHIELILSLVSVLTQAPKLTFTQLWRAKDGPNGYWDHRVEQIEYDEEEAEHFLKELVERVRANEGASEIFQLAVRRGPNC